MADTSAVLAGVRDLLPTLGERAQETEDAASCRPRRSRRSRRRGSSGCSSRARYGGLEADPGRRSTPRCATSPARAGRPAGSPRWSACTPGSSPCSPTRRSRTVWGDRPATRLSSSYAPTGRATHGRRRLPAHRPVELLLRLRPRQLGAARRPGVRGRTGQAVDFRTFLVPRDDYTIVDVWHIVGLRGTGSNDIVVDDVFVPGHRTLSFTATGRCACPGQQVNTGRRLQLAVRVGLLRAPSPRRSSAWRRVRTRPTSDWTRSGSGLLPGGKAADDSFNQVRIAEAAALMSTPRGWPWSGT